MRIEMKTKTISTLISVLVASSAFAVTYDPANSPTPLGKDGTYVQLSAPEGTTDAIFDGQGQSDLYYVVLSKSNPEEDANFTIVNGFSAIRGGTGEILTFKQQSASKGIDATLTLKDGTYNLATSDASELIVTSAGYTNGVNSSRAIVFDSSTTTNLFTSSAKFQGVTSAKVVSKGTINVYNTTYTTSVPSDVAYGQLHTYGTFIQESGTINANDMLVESVNCNINGTLNLKQKSGSTHYPVKISDQRGLTFGKDAKLTTTANSRIQLNKDSTLTIQSGEKSIAVDLIMFNGDNGTLNLSGKNSVVHTNGKFDTVLLTYASKNVAKINVDDTNTFGATYVANSPTFATDNTSIRLEIDFNFTSDDQYLNLGEIYTGHDISGVDPVFYVKDFKNGYLRASSIRTTGSGHVGETKLYIFNEASQQYEFTESQWIGNATDGFILTVAVPEPAEWAMIFGALALGFAIYRRRK